VTICPCCGQKSETDLYQGCACGARAVGEPLPKPDNELPSYFRSLLMTTIGTLMVIVLLVETIVSLASRKPLSFGLESWVAATETAAWRLRFIAIPLTILALWASRKLYRSMMKTPERFCGLKYARRGLRVSVAVPFVIALLIGVTVPARVRHYQWGLEAGINVQGHTLGAALVEYQEEFGTLPAEISDLKRLPDPTGSIAEALKTSNTMTYTRRADVAAIPSRKPRSLNGAVIRNASLTTDDVPEGLSFTNYDLRLAGEDKLLNTEDDLLVRDGMVMRASEIPVHTPPASAVSKTLKR